MSSPALPAKEGLGLLMSPPRPTPTDLRAACVVLAAAVPEEGSSPEEYQEGLHPGACKKARGSELFPSPAALLQQPPWPGSRRLASDFPGWKGPSLHLPSPPPASPPTISR